MLESEQLAKRTLEEQLSEITVSVCSVSDITVSVSSVSEITVNVSSVSEII